MTRNAVYADTLEWGFEKDITICLPVNTTLASPWSDYNHVTATTTTTTVLTSSSSSSSSSTLPHQDTSLLHETCFSLHLSLPNPDVIEVYPYLLLTQAWLTDESKSDCPWYLQPNSTDSISISYAVLCLNISTSYTLGTVSFYHSNTSSFGQTPLTSYDEAIQLYSTSGMFYMGTCSFPLVYHPAGVLPVNTTELSTTHVTTNTPIPTSSPAATMYPTPTASYQSPEPSR